MAGGGNQSSTTWSPRKRSVLLFIFLHLALGPPVCRPATRRTAVWVCARKPTSRPRPIGRTHWHKAFLRSIAMASTLIAMASTLGRSCPMTHLLLYVTCRCLLLPKIEGDVFVAKPRHSSNPGHSKTLPIFKSFLQIGQTSFRCDSLS